MSFLRNFIFSKTVIEYRFCIDSPKKEQENQNTRVIMHPRLKYDKVLQRSPTASKKALVKTGQLFRICLLCKFGYCIFFVCVCVSNFLMPRSVRLSVGWMVGRSVCQNFLKGQEFTLAPIGALVFCYE